MLKSKGADFKCLCFEVPALVFLDFIFKFTCKFFSLAGAFG